MKVLSNTAAQVEAVVTWLHTQCDPFVPQELPSFIEMLEAWHPVVRQTAPRV